MISRKEKNEDENPSDPEIYKNEKKMFQQKSEVSKQKIEK